jgi:hypothetical protein
MQKLAALRTWKRFYQQMTDARSNQYKGPNFSAAAPDENYAHDDFVDSLSIACSLTKDLVMPEVRLLLAILFSSSTTQTA